MKQVKKKQVVFSTLVALACAGHIGYASNTATTTENGVTNNYWDITINNVSEDHGLELGTNTRARGNGSIATGKNSVAIGNNAVATGGNETKESITSKLNENKQKLADIAKAEANTKSLLNELQTIRKQEADVLEAGERVKQVKRAKATAYERYQTAQKKYEEAKAGAADFLKATQAKIDDFNSRLSAVNKLGGVDINSEQGLTNAATQLKQMTEQGTTLDLPLDRFYKEYIKAHYKAIGDLRLNNIRNNAYKKPLNGYINDPITHKKVINPYNLSSGFGYDISDNVISGGVYGNNQEGLIFIDYKNDDTRLDKGMFNQDSTLLNKPTKNIIYKNIYTELSSEQELIDAKEQAPKYKQSFKEYFKKNDYPLMTPAIKEKLCTEFNKKVDYFVKGIEITYYQKQYEDTHNTTWLDKKNTALQEYDKLEKSYNLKDVSRELNNNFDKWYKENITDIEEKNKITTATLTSELEKALQINKNAALDKEKEIEDLKKAAAQALATYNNTNPSDADIMLSQRYDAIMKELSTKANELKSEQERLQALKEALTLHDLTNVGENAVAIGTQSLATGTDSLAIGTSSVATGNNAIAIGKNTSVTTTNSAAVGVDHIITGETSSTLGYKNTIYGTNSYAIGSMNTIGATSTQKGSNTFVLGNNVTTTANNAVVLGANSTATEDNVVSIGAEKQERKIIHVADGTVSESSTDAVNGKQLYNAMQNTGKANTALDNITNEGKTIIRNLSKEAVQLENGTNTTVESRVNGNSTIYKVNVSNDTITGVITPKLTELSNSVDTKLGTKANKDASNLSSDDVKTWSEKLGTGSISPENTGLVNGGTVHTAIKNAVTTATSTINNDIDIKLTGKANTSLDNITDEGKTIIRNLSKEAVQLENGTNTTVESRVNGNSTIYKVNVSNDTITGVITPKLTELSNSVDTKLGTKANKDASNLSADDVKTWNEKLGTGSAKAGDKGLITGDTLHTALANVQIDPATLTSKANTNASNLTDENVKEWTSKLGIGTVADGNTGLVTGGTVYSVIKDKSNTSDITNLSTNIDNKLATKANVDGSNINVTKFREKLGTGLVEEHNYNLVTGDTVFNAIKNLQANPIATQDIMKNREDINYLKGETSHVGAISAALAGLHPQEFDDDYKFSIAAAQGTYNHANATALGAFYRPNENFMFSVAGTVSSGNKAYNVGVSYKFGSYTHGKKRQLASENNELKQRLLVLEKIVNKLMLEDKKETFPDVPSTRWDAEAVETLHANGIVTGYPDGTFKGDQQMTRSEYAQMVYNVLHKK